MVKERWGIIDYETGETVALQAPQRKGRKEPPWVKVYQSRTMELLKKKRLRGESLFVLVALLAKVGYGNQVPGPTSMARELDRTQAAVSRAYRELQDSGFILKRDRMYFLDPWFCWKGTPGQQSEFMKQLTAGEG